MSEVKQLFFKDSVYEEIFGTKPLLFRQYSDGTIRYSDNNDVSDELRIDVYSEAEILFGAHSIDGIALMEFALDIVHEAFGWFKYTNRFLKGVEVFKLLFFSGSIIGSIGDETVEFFDKYLSDNAPEQYKNIIEWSGNLTGLLFTTIEGALEFFTPPNLQDIKIYKKVQSKNFNTYFEVDENSEISLDEIISITESN